MTKREIANKFSDDIVLSSAKYIAFKGKIDFPSMEGINDIIKSSGNSQDNDAGCATEPGDK
jgi:hypothetical protein